MSARRTVLLPGNAQPLGGYPHAHIANGFVYVSGTSSRRADGTIAGADRVEAGSPVLDIRQQTEAVIQNLALVLHAAGAGLEHLVSITSFLVSMNDFAGYNEVYTHHFSAATGPARTTVAVQALPHPLLLIEMHAVAVLPTGDTPIPKEEEV